ncbi:MAG: hypothetical protein PHZ19_12240 [Candidatus Thermoplasmatota archaeon]|nr:hypothetical protein [Candidatus Thermoplasmatota archaeon]
MFEKGDRVQFTEEHPVAREKYGVMSYIRQLPWGDHECAVGGGRIYAGRYALERVEEWDAKKSLIPRDSGTLATG